MSLNGALYIGASGLQTSQNALNTVAHNLSNLSTTGYVRQQVAQTDTRYNTISTTPAVSNMQTGDGTVYSEVRHIRDAFLDASYREETGRYSYYEVSYDSIKEIENILGELDNPAFSKSLDTLWTSLQELAKSPGDTINVSTLVQSAYSFIQNANAVYSSFTEYQDNLNVKIKKYANRINEIGDRINELNKAITSREVGSIEHANDLRDQRDALLDELSGYVPISYKENTSGCVTVKVNGVDFVTENTSYHLGLLQDDDTKFYTPYWTQNVVQKYNAETGEQEPDYSGAYMFDLTQEISTYRDTDVGGLRALLLARGDHYGNYLDLDTETMTDDKLNALGIGKNEYTGEDGLTYYNKYISMSTMMNTEAEFDKLVHNVITTLNGLIQTAANPKTGYLCNEDGTPSQIFTKNVGDAYTKVTADELAANPAAIDFTKDTYYPIYDAEGNETGDYWLYAAEDPNDSSTWYSAGNTQINQELLQTPAILDFTKGDQEKDYPLIKEYIDTFENSELYLNPNATKPSDITEFYSDYVSQITNSGSVYKGLYEYQQDTVEQVEYERQGVIGVSSDEELERMITYQNAYNASSRYINVICDMLDSVLAMAQ